MRDGLPPNDLARREPHNDINVRRGLGNCINIVAKAVRFGEQDLGQVVLLSLRLVVPITGHEERSAYLGGGGHIKPLEGAVDVGKGKDSVVGSLCQLPGQTFVDNNSRDEG